MKNNETQARKYLQGLRERAVEGLADSERVRDESGYPGAYGALVAHMHTLLAGLRASLVVDHGVDPDDGPHTGGPQEGP